MHLMNARYASWYRITLRWSLDGDFPTKAEVHEVLSDGRANAIRCVLGTSERAGAVVSMLVKRTGDATDEEAAEFFRTIGEPGDERE